MASKPLGSDVTSSKRHGKLRTINCRPCRERKVRCDRLVPCKSCIRHSREDQCYSNPSPIARGKVPISKLNDTNRANVVQRPVTLSYSEQVHSPPPSSVEDVDEHCSIRPRRDDLSISIADLMLEKVGSLHTLNHSEALRKIRSSKGTENGIQEQHPHCQFLPNLIGNLSLQFPIFTTLHSTNGATVQESNQWKLHLLNMLPPKDQCDLLVSYFFENINFIYQAIHAPTFRKEYSEFWDSPLQDVNLIWLSLLYIMICLSGLYIPVAVIEAVGFQTTEIRQLAHIWYSSSRQCLHAGNFESKPCLTQLQTFLISQLYWYATKNVEILNSCLGQTLRNAQAIGLDKDLSIATNLRQEMRHRIWWDLCSSDTQPMIQAHLSEVPIPLNCDDTDFTDSGINPRPMDEPTVMSMNVYRAKLFKIFNKLFSNNGASLSSFEFVSKIDAEIVAQVAEFPWYFKLKENGDCIDLPPAFESILWQHHILHSCICLQRIRICRPFLRSHKHPAWSTCTAAAEGVLAVYKALRNKDIARFQKSQKFPAQAYQILSPAILLATLLLVERPAEPSKNIRQDIEMVIADLKRLTDLESPVPMATDGRHVLRKILSIYDSRSDERDNSERAALVPEIYSVMGGQNTTRSYLERCTITYIVNGRNTCVDLSVHEQSGAYSSSAQTQSLHPSSPLRSLPSNAAGIGYCDPVSWDLDGGLASQTYDIPFEDLSWELGDFLFPDSQGCDYT